MEFNIKGKFIVCNMSNFTLGGEVRVMNNGKCETVVHAKTIEDAKNIVYSMAAGNGISNVFLVPLAPMNNEKVLHEFKSYGETNFSKTFDKIHFHMI